MNPNSQLLPFLQRRLSQRLRSRLGAHRRQHHGARRLFVGRLLLDDRRADRAKFTRSRARRSTAAKREIQMQSYPFHMTAENLAKHRLDPNIDFWKELKNGADHFEVTKTEPSVVVCGKHYVFGATADGDVDATPAVPDAAARRPGRGRRRGQAVRATRRPSPRSSPRASSRCASSIRTAARTPPSSAATSMSATPRRWRPGRPRSRSTQSGKPIPAVVKVAAAPTPRTRKRAPSRRPGFDDRAGRRLALAVRLGRRHADGGQNMVKKWFGLGAGARQFAFSSRGADSLRRAPAAQAQRRARRAGPAGLRRRAHRRPAGGGKDQGRRRGAVNSGSGARPRAALFLDAIMRFQRLAWRFAAT